MWTIIIPLVAVLLGFGIAWKRGRRFSFQNQIAPVLAPVGLIAFGAASCAGNAASVSTEEIAKVELIPFEDAATRGDGKAYVLETQRIDYFGNDISRSYWIQIAGPNGMVQKLKAPRNDGALDIRQCDLSTPPDPPVMITYRTKLLYPGMRRWIIWVPRTYKCIGGDSNFIHGIQEPHE